MTSSGHPASGLRQTLVFAALFVIALLLTHLPLSAQSTTEGAIGGTVYDSKGAVLPDAHVSVRNNGTNAETSVVTDSSGYYRVNRLQPSSYSVTIDAQGFTTYKSEKVIVEVGRVTEISPRLNVGGSTEQVNVSAEAPTVNTTTPDFAPVLNSVAIENLPINGGRWSSFAVLTPGVVSNQSGFGLLSFRGISSILNNNTVDGADNNQAFFSEERGRTRAGYSTAKVAVQEFQVNTSNYSSEYGRAAGGVVNTVTKSGTNEIHGEAYFYDRDNSWGATNPYTTLTTQSAPGVFTTSPYKPKDIRTMWGFGVGGPLIKDKLFWFVAFDDYHRNFPGTAIPSSPKSFFATPGSSDLTTLSSRLGVSKDQALTLYNNGLNGLLTMLGPVPRKGDQTIVFPKIDWNINQGNHASVSVNRMRWASPAGIQTQSSNTFGIASFGNDYVKDTWGVGKLDTLVTSHIANQARYQYGRDFEFENNQPPSAYELANLVNPTGYTNPLGLPPQVFITNGFTFGVPSFLERPRYPDERRQQFADTVSWQWRNHAIKFGGDYSHVNDNTANLRYQYGGYSYSSLVNYFSDLYGQNTCTSGKLKVPCYSNFQQAFGPLGFKFNTNDLAFFAEDNWQVMPRLSLTFGLRWEYEMLPNPVIPNAAVPATSHFPDDRNNFGPRFGFAYDVYGNGKTSIRGGYGIYYGRIINSTIYNALINTGNSAGQLQYFFTPTTPGAPVFPQILPTATGTIKPNLVFFDHNFQAPQIHQADLSFQQDLGWNTVLSLSYLGSFGRQLPGFVDTNIGSPSSITYQVKGGPITTPTYTTLFYSTRPNSSFGSMTDIFSGINSSYNAGVVQLNKRFSNNVQFAANYTWSHAIDYGQNESTFSDTNDLLVPTNLALERADSVLDVRHRFTLSMVASSPWHANGALGYLVNGWQISPVYQVQTGLPYSLLTAGTPSQIINNKPVSGLGSSINGSGGANRIDVTGRDAYRYPATNVVDLRISKLFNFGERYRAEVSGDAFNILNHQNVTGVQTTGYIIGKDSNNNPTLTYNAPFSSINNSNSNFIYTSRQIQIGARFFF